MIRVIPLRRAAVVAEFVADVLDTAEHREQFSAGTAVVGAEPAGEALLFAGAPVGDQPDESAAMYRPAPGRPNRAGLAGVALLRPGLGLRLVAARRQEYLVTI